jgi:hypothetical protein
MWSIRHRPSASCAWRALFYAHYQFQRRLPLLRARWPNFSARKTKAIESCLRNIKERAAAGSIHLAPSSPSPLKAQQRRSLKDRTRGTKSTKSIARDTHACSPRSASSPHFQRTKRANRYNFKTCLHHNLPRWNTANFVECGTKYHLCFCAYILKV